MYLIDVKACLLAHIWGNINMSLTPLNNGSCKYVNVQNFTNKSFKQNELYL